MVGELRQLTWIRILMFLREPEAVFWVFLFPLVLALVLGIAFKNRGIEVQPIGVIAGTLDDRWITPLEEAEGLRVVHFDNEEVAARKLRSGAVSALVKGDETLTLRFDPTRPEGETARLRVDDAVQSSAGQTAIIRIIPDEVVENGARYIDFLIPGLLGMNLMGTGIWGVGFAIVDMRQKKLLKLLMVTPMRRQIFLLAQMYSRFAFLVAEVTLIVLFGVFVLGVPFRGSVLLFAAVCILGAFCFTALGLLIASRAQTIEGVSGLMNFTMMPMWLLSGVFFTYERFPEFLLPFIRVLPLTALNDALRDVMLEGEGIAAVGTELLVLAGWTVVTFAVALKIFRWR